MYVSRTSYYIVGAKDSDGMRYLSGPITLCPNLESAMVFVTSELANASLESAKLMRPQLQWQVLHAHAEIHAEPA